ncbi:hypothetical protein ACFL4T_02825 [candidate division KSB1 bacterium]
MKHTSTIFGIMIMIVLIFCSCTKQSEFPELKGPYLGQTPPGDVPEIFAPGIISTGFNVQRCTFSPDGKECFYSIMVGWYETILWTRVKNGRWTVPEVAPFSGKYYEGYPSFHPDGSKLYFHSYRPEDGETEFSEGANIWVVKRTDSGWGVPEILGPSINGKGSVSGPSVTTDGTLYFAQWQDNKKEFAMRAKFVNGVYQAPEPLPAHLRSSIHSCISPDESYLIIPKGKTEDLSGGGQNYYVSFRSEDGVWSNLIDLGDKIRSPRSGAGYFPTISSDGNYFFFQAKPRAKFIKRQNKELDFSDLQKELLSEPAYDRGTIFWVESSFIEELKSDEFK